VRCTLWPRAFNYFFRFLVQYNVRAIAQRTKETDSKLVNPSFTTKQIQHSYYVYLIINNIICDYASSRDETRRDGHVCRDNK